MEYVGECRCYVRHLSAETRYSLHNGAHNPACPWYRESLDPVDRMHDKEFRKDNETTGDPAILEQGGHRYVGHWHGDIAVFSDGQAFRAGRGWLGYRESQDLIPRICQCSPRAAQRLSDYS